MLTNSYVGIVEQEVPGLVVSRARRLRITGDEIDDLQQQIVPTLAEFQYDPTRSNGASRTTAMTAVVDRQIKAHLRAKRRYRSRLERLQVLSGAWAYGRPTHHVTHPEPVDLRLDLAAAMASLSTRDLAICQGLADDLTVKAIALQAGCGRDTVDRAIVRIREVFTSAGLRAWVDPDYGCGKQA